MSLLTLLLIIKVIFTLFVVVLVFGFANKSKLESLTSLSGASPLLFRLYAVAIAALLVNYSFGIAQSLQQIFPMAAVVVGIVSNGGAAFLLIKERVTQIIPIAMASIYSILFFGLITVGLVLSLIFQTQSIQILW